MTVKRGFPVIEPIRVCRHSGACRREAVEFKCRAARRAVIVDNSSGEIKGIGGMGFWWEEEVDSSRFVKLFLDGIKQAAGLSKTGIQVFELVYHEMRANPGSTKSN